MRLLALLMSIYSLYGCREIEDVLRIDSPGLPSPIDLQVFADRQDEVEERLIENFVQFGYVAPLNSQYEPELGDSLLWTGISMGIFDCSEAKVFFDAVESSALNRQGALVRAEPLPEKYVNDPTSRDMIVGAIFGLVLYAKKCDKIRPQLLLKLFMNFVRSNQGRIHSHGDSTKINVQPGFRYFLNLISWKLLNTPKPVAIDAGSFEAGLISGAVLITSSKEACYPLHLTTLMAITLAVIEEPISQTSKMSFCELTAGSGLNLTDWFCGRNDGKDFLHSYEFDSHDYIHQRCESWESIEHPGFNPGLDWLILKKLSDGSAL